MKCIATGSAERVLWQLSRVKAQLQAGQVPSWQSKPEQPQLGGLAHSMQSLCPATGNGRVLFLGYGTQGLGCRSMWMGGRVGVGSWEDQRHNPLYFDLPGRRWECLEPYCLSGMHWL